MLHVRLGRFFIDRVFPLNRESPNLQRCGYELQPALGDAGRRIRKYILVPFHITDCRFTPFHDLRMMRPRPLPVYVGRLRHAHFFAACGVDDRSAEKDGLFVLQRIRDILMRKRKCRPWKDAAGGAESAGRIQEKSQIQGGGNGDVQL